MPAPSERSRDVYEILPGYRKPPLISLPDPDDMASLEEDLTGALTGKFRFKLLHLVLQVTGFCKFIRALSDGKLEGLLRRTDIRRIRQCAPAISATVNLLDDPREISPVERAATLLLASRQLYSEIRAGTLSPDRYRDEVLEMGQYPNLFATNIVWEGRGASPRIFKSTDTSHVIVAIGRQLYSLDLGDLESELSIEHLTGALDELKARSESNPLPADEPSLGLLTCAKIDTQRQAFRILRRVRENRHILNILQHSLLTICLDLDQLPESDGDAARMAHSENPCNRWHHSSLQLVVFGNAKACAIFRYDAYIDGNAMTRGAAEIQKRAVLIPLPSLVDHPAKALPPATPLRCKIAPGLSQMAWTEIRSILDNQKATFDIPGIGRSFFKSRNFEPVPAFVLAIHLTMAHFTGKSVKIEQLLTLSKYRCMGLTAAVVTTSEVEKFSQYMNGNEVQSDTARKLMLAAIDSQTKQCRRGRSHLPFSQLIPLYSGSQRGIHKIYGAVIAITCQILDIKWDAEVILSHPSAYPEAPMLGRPGVRLPYAKYFGLHYRMQDNHITVCMMPSAYWSVSNAEFMAVLRRNLHRLKEMIA